MQTCPLVPVLDVATQCRNKVKYISYASAHQECVRLVQKEQVPFTIYECPHCGSLHIGRVG